MCAGAAVDTDGARTAGAWLVFGRVGRGQGAADGPAAGGCGY